MTIHDAIKALEDGRKIIVRDGVFKWQVYPDPRFIGRYRVDDLCDPFWQWRESNMKTPLQAIQYIWGKDVSIEEIHLDYEMDTNKRQKKTKL